jgi:hypothetical protein
MMEIGKGTIKTKGCKLLLDAIRFAGARRRNRIQNNRIRYNLNKWYNRPEVAASTRDLVPRH